MTLNENQQNSDPNPKPEDTSDKEFFIINEQDAENEFKEAQKSEQVNAGQPKPSKPAMHSPHNAHQASNAHQNFNQQPNQGYPQAHIPEVAPVFPQGQQQFNPNQPPVNPHYNPNFRYPPPMQYMHQGYQPYPVAPKKGKKSLGLIILILICFIGLIYFFGKSFTSSDKHYSTGLQEEIVAGVRSSNKIAIINVDGIIIEGGGGGGLFGINISSAYEMLYNGLIKAEYDDNVKAVLLYLNTPGGGLTSSDVLYHRIQEFKRRTGYKKPVIAFMKDVTASGGYYVASACDYIIASPTTITGSIGVLMQGYNLSGLMDKLGIEDATITSVPYKDRGSMMRPAKPYDREFFKVLLGKMHKMFVDKVYEGRLAALKNQGKSITRAEVESWATGDIYLAEDALKMNMIDEVGYEKDALQATLSKINLENAQFVRYFFRRRGLSLMDLAGLEKSENLPKALMNFDYEKVIRDAGPRIWAIWLGDAR